jgi:hypothetical protein
MNIKTWLLALAALVLAAPGFAREEKAGDPPEQAASTGKSAEIVAVDTEAKRITIKGRTADSAADPETLVVEGKALAGLKDFQAGDKVLVTCKLSGDAAVSSQQPSAQPGSDASTTKAEACVVTEIAKDEK